MPDPVTFEDLVARIEDLEHGPSLQQLPLNALKDYMESDWQPDSGVLLQPASITSSLLADDVVPRMVRGEVSSLGVPVLGTGFTVVRNSAGNYTVTFTTPYAAVPVLTATPLDATFKTVQLTAQSASAFTVQTFNSAFAATDSAFNFVAVQA